VRGLALTLVGARVFGNGNVLLRYRRDEWPDRTPTA
jgi:hypothetical protein